MSKAAPQFRSIATPLQDVPDTVLNALGDRLGVPTLTRPEQPPAPKPSVQAASAFMEVSHPPAPASQTIQAAVTIPAEGPCPQEKLTVELPAYLTQALRKDCAEKRVTQRYLVLQGLKAIGYVVEDADLVPDHRRPQGKTVRP